MTPIDKSGRYYFFNKLGERVITIVNFYERKDLVNLLLYPHGISESGSVFVESRESVNTIIDDILRSAIVNVHMFGYII